MAAPYPSACPPILLLLFNRPDYTRILLEKVKDLEVDHLFIAADGPRKDHAGDTEGCQQVKALADATVFRAKHVHKLYQPHNLGCRAGVTTAIDWFFENVEAGMILEDDCIPEADFPRFCSEMLYRYRDREDVFAVCGHNFLFNSIRIPDSYYFSKYFHAWGWASWRRAWQKYDRYMSSFPEFRQQDALSAYPASPEERDFHYRHFEEVFREPDRIDTWDFDFTFSVMKHHGCCIIPAVSLVRNIGFGDLATHTQQAPYWYPYIETGSVGQITHPASIEINQAADELEFRFIQQRRYSPPLYKRLRRLLDKFLHS